MADADSSADALIAEYGLTLAAVSAYSHRVADLAASARVLAEADGSPESLELVRRIDAGDFRWGFHIADNAEGGAGAATTPMTNEDIDAAIAATGEAAAFGPELLAEGQSIVDRDDDGHLLRRDPDGTVTPLD